MIDDLYFVIKKDNLYLYRYAISNINRWTRVPADAHRYQSTVVWEHAEDSGGEVFLVLPEGREIEVLERDFRRSE